jgi:hypothetical protein
MGPPGPITCADPIPAGANGVLYVINKGILSARLPQSPTPLWTFPSGALTIAPIVVNQIVVVGSSAGEIFALDAKTGNLLSMDEIGTPIGAPAEGRTYVPLTGMAAANDRVFVPAGGALYAY